MEAAGVLQDVQIRGSEKDSIAESHASLFRYDEEISKHFHAQLDVANHHISFLEERLRETTRAFEGTRKSLYLKEVAYHHEANARMTADRHLRLEQARHNDCIEAYHSLYQQNGLLMTSLHATTNTNANLTEELESLKTSNQALAMKASELENLTKVCTELSNDEDDARMFQCLTMAFQPTESEHLSPIPAAQTCNMSAQVGSDLMSPDLPFLLEMSEKSEPIKEDVAAMDLESKRKRGYQEPGIKQKKPKKARPAKIILKTESGNNEGKDQ